VFQELFATGMNSSGCLIVLHSGVVQGRKSTKPRSSLCSITRSLEIEGQLRGKFWSLTQRRCYSVIPGPSGHILVRVPSSDILLEYFLLHRYYLQNGWIFYL